MALKRLIGLVFAGGLIFSAAAADFVIRIAPPRVVAQRRDRATGPAAMCGFRDIRVGMAKVMRGSPADGNSLHGPAPAGLRIAGLTKGTATGF